MPQFHPSLDLYHYNLTDNEPLQMEYKSERGKLQESYNSNKCSVKTSQHNFVYTHFIFHFQSVSSQ